MRCLLGRITGVLYLALALLGMCSPMFLESTVVPGDAALAVTFYVLLRGTDRAVALAAQLPRLFEAYRLLTGAESGVDDRAFADLEAFRTGFSLALVFFGVHLALLGYLLHRSGLVPRVLGALVGVSGVAYLIDSFGSLLTTGYGGALAGGLILLMLVGELGLVGWLLVRGVAAREEALSGR
ncbi:DUF4386 domain-containing protein [Virgisporangium aurantiacum]|uniref:DUF4386 domain-containing protein n=1 Tax=Virgisporangium aurantiacum TaxID=175570 RepID=A0A8J3Z6U7_9ACTN|nr:DUF4386 domain-containing protein [Virgisporangium aurantiacum]GIJ55973.1 hypothetical protein Vau01_034890 [Virgisporangium aurantiacum]